MAFIPQNDVGWLKLHAVQDPKTNNWTCRKTGADIEFKATGRSIHRFGLPMGDGEVRRVWHAYCTGCNPNFEPPSYGTPIQESELCTVS